MLYEREPVNTLDTGAFWRVVEVYKVKTLFSAPTAFRAIKKEDPEATLLQQHDLSRCKRYLWLANALILPLVNGQKHLRPAGCLPLVTDRNGLGAFVLT